MPEPDGVTLELPFGDHAGAIARRELRSRLSSAGTAPDLIEDALLLASELVANATRFGGPPVRMRVEIDDRSVLVAVHDCADQLPGPAPTEPVPVDQVGGRGLAIVAALARDWGVQASRPGPGKEIWFRLDRAPAAEQP